MWLISLEVRLMSHVLWCYLLSATWTAPWRSLMRTQPTWLGSRLPSQRIYPNVKLHSTMSWLQYSSNPNPCFKDLKCLPKGEWEGVWTSLEALLQEESKSATREPTEESEDSYCVRQTLIQMMMWGLTGPWASTEQNPPSARQTDGGFCGGQLMQRPIQNCPQVSG